MFSRVKNGHHPWWCNTGRCHAGVNGFEHRSTPQKFGPLQLTMVAKRGSEHKPALEIWLRVRLVDNGEAGREHAKRVSAGVLHAVDSARSVQTASKDHVWQNDHSDSPTTPGGAQW